MEWNEILKQIIDLCVIPLLCILTTCLIKYISIKSQEVIANTNNAITSKYVAMLADTIANCVLATKQTYVESLKKDNAFTKDAQKEAFNLTFNAVMSVLTDDAKEYLTALYGDLEAYITSKIETEVSLTK